jgi:UMF1 family MFS transporter
MNNENRSIYSWAMYDWANSAFATTVMAGFFPLFFDQYWADPNNQDESTFYLGLGNSVASLIVGAMAPFLGAIADRASAKKKLLTLFAFLGIIMTGGLWMVEQGHWQMAVFFYVLAAVGFAGGNIFYDSLLPGVTSKEKIDWVSSLGYGLGYIGGGLLFLVNVLMFLKPELFGISDSAAAIKISFLTVAIWWAVFTIPLWLFVNEPRIYEKTSLLNAVSLGWQQLRGTFREIRHLKVVFLFLLAYWFYIDGVDTIVKMAVKYGLDLGFPSESLITALLIVQFVAFPATLLYSWVAKNIGVKNAIFVAIFGYSFITLLGYFMQEQWHFFILAMMVGYLLGIIQPS